MALRRGWLSFGFLLALSASPAPGLAHIDLVSPRARAAGRPDTYLGEAPCGQIVGGRDPERVSTFEPGQTIVVEWDIYQRHVSYFRLAVDLDGDDSFSARPSLPAEPAGDDLALLPPNPGEHILAYVRDDAARLDHVAEPVTLPDVECERCTLQLIQVSYGLPLRDATYYQCADLVLRRSAPGGAGPGDAGSDGPGAPELASGCALQARSGAPLPGSPLPGALGLALVALCRRARRGRRARGGASRGAAPACICARRCGRAAMERGA